MWDTIFKLINSTSLCAHHSLLQFKVVHRTHISKTKLSRFHPDVDPCCKEEASLIHIFWTCPSLEKYWREAFQTLSLIVNLDIEPKPLVTLFGNKGEVDGHLRPAKWPTLLFASLLARCAMLLMWRDAALPTHAQWLRDVMTCLNLEKIHYSIRNSKEKFQKSVGTFSGILSWFSIKLRTGSLTHTLLSVPMSAIPSAEIGPLSDACFWPICGFIIRAQAGLDLWGPYCFSSGYFYFLGSKAWGAEGTCMYPRTSGARNPTVIVVKDFYFSPDKSGAVG